MAQTAETPPAATPFTAEDARRIFDEAIARIDPADGERIAHLELAREYFTNPDFRAHLEEYLWQLNQARR
jgi:hypothetical protein